jgi:hypothetical protein
VAFGRFVAVSEKLSDATGKPGRAIYEADRAYGSWSDFRTFSASRRQFDRSDSVFGRLSFHISENSLCNYRIFGNR